VDLVSILNGERELKGQSLHISIPRGERGPCFVDNLIAKNISRVAVNSGLMQLQVCNVAQTWDGIP